MTATHDLERRLADLYAAEAPARAPDWLLDGALRAIDSTPQRRAFLPVPRRFPHMNAYAKWAAAAVVVVAVGAIGFAVLRPAAQPAAVPSASPSSAAPSAMPQSSPASAPEATQQLAAAFQPPFAYTLPAGADFQVVSGDPRYFEARIPAANDAGTPAGLIIQTIGGGRSDPCSEASPALDLVAGPRAVFDYLKTIPQLDVTEESVTAVGSNAAWQGLVQVVSEEEPCVDIWPWADQSASFPEGPPMRVVAVDVGGQHVVLTVFGEDAYQPWDAMADEFIGSMQFVESSGGRIAPPLSETFTSSRHGFTISYPEGWATQAASEPWTGGDVYFRQPHADYMYDPAKTDHLFIRIASQPIGDSTPDAWVAQAMAPIGCPATEPISIDGADGLIGTVDCNVTAVATNGRGYLILLYTSGDEGYLDAVYDRAWFEDVLATVKLHPEDAVD